MYKHVNMQKFKYMELIDKLKWRFSHQGNEREYGS